jgi:hypothetical protein
MVCELNPMKNLGMGEVRNQDAVSIAIRPKRIPVVITVTINIAGVSIAIEVAFF